MTVPTSTGLYPYDPIADQIADRRDLLAAGQRSAEEAQHKADQAAQTAADAVAKAAASPDDAALRATADAAKTAAADASVEARTAADAVQTLADMAKRLERQMDQRTLRPVFLLRVPNFRLNTRFDQLAARLPQQPSDRRLFHAMRAAVADGAIPADDPDYLALLEAFRASGTAGVPEHVAGLFEDLYVRVGDHPAVKDFAAARVAYKAGYTALRLRVFLAGVEGLPGAEAFGIGSDGLATEESLDIIPPEEIDGILSRIDRLGTLRGREGNSSGSPSPLPSSPKRSKTA